MRAEVCVVPDVIIVSVLSVTWVWIFAPSMLTVGVVPAATALLGTVTIPNPVPPLSPVTVKLILVEDWFEVSLRFDI